MSKLREMRSVQQEKKGFDWTYVAIAVVVGLALFSVYFIFFQPSPNGQAVGNTAGIEDDDPFKGGVNAPVTIVQFSDFQCPACAAAAPTVKRIAEAYGDKVKIVYRDFPLINTHPFAQKAAEAAECADEQGKFWEMHDVLFQNQQSLGVPALKQYAVELDLNQEQFNSCLDSSKYAAEVASDESAGISLGVRGTPTFFINGVRYSNMSFEQFKAVIDPLLG